MQKYADRTSFPDIYKKSYWGNFHTENKVPSDEIIGNRNDFITDHEVLRYRETYPNYVPGHFGFQLWFNKTGSFFWDHIEIYETPTEFLVIVSPYGEQHAEQPAVFEKIPRMYTEDATTYMARVPKRARRDQSPRRRKKS